MMKHDWKFLLLLCSIGTDEKYIGWAYLEYFFFIYERVSIFIIYKDDCSNFLTKLVHVSRSLWIFWIGVVVVVIHIQNGWWEILIIYVFVCIFFFIIFFIVVIIFFSIEINMCKHLLVVTRLLSLVNFYKCVHEKCFVVFYFFFCIFISFLFEIFVVNKQIVNFFFARKL